MDTVIYARRRALVHKSIVDGLSEGERYELEAIDTLIDEQPLPEWVMRMKRRADEYETAREQIRLFRKTWGV